MIEPHGGRLVDRTADESHAEHIKRAVVDGPANELDPGQYQDFINIANGRYSPLTGFLDHNNFKKVVSDMTLEDGTTWPLPVVVDASPARASDLTLGDWTALRDPDGRLVGAIEIDDIYKYDEEGAVAEIFGTNDDEHPGVERFRSRDEFFIGGDVLMFERERYNGVDLLPKETRVLFEHKGWETIVGFQTRNAPHRAHEYIQKSALEHVDGLLIQPKLGDKKSGDYRDEVIVGAYQTLLEHYYPDDQTALSVFPSKMSYAGPREAVFDAIVRKNQGCSHIIIGRDHAGVGEYYGGYASQRVFEQIGDIGIEPLFYNYSFYCDRCDGMASEKICPHDESLQAHPSGTEIREAIQSGSRPSEKMIRPEVTTYLMECDRPFITDSTTGGDR